MDTMKNAAEVDLVFRGFLVATMSLDVDSLPGSDATFGLLNQYVVGVKDGQIAFVSPEAEVDFQSVHDTDIVEGNGNLLTPGLIDCHTHLVYGGNRADEWARRISGESYESIAAAGGGILSSVKSTRAAVEDQLFESAKKRLARLMQEGVTTVEIKSGYGLDLDTELKMLRVANRLGAEMDVDVSSTLLAAHAVPPEFKGAAGDYVDLVCDEIIPASKRLCSAVDVFCESIAFDIEQSRRVLETASDLNLKTKIHAEQLSHFGAAAMAAGVGALSADHLEYLSDEDCKMLAEHGTVATLLPGAFYCLRETQKPPVESLLANGVPIAIATDSNPGSSPMLSILLAANMSCILFGLTPGQAIAGITRNAALALGMLDSRGTIEVGKQADFAIWDVESPAEMIYPLGGNSCVGVYKNGKAL